jgi:hypothetical protein
MVPSRVGGTRFGKDRENQGCRNRRHATEGVVLCVLILLAACGSPPAPKIDLSNCSAGTANIAFPVDDRSQFDPYGTLSWPPVTGATAYVLTAGTQANSTDVWSGTIYGAASAQVPGLQPFTTYYFQLAAQTGASCSVTSASATSGAGLAHLKTPADGGTEIDPEVNFSWNGVVDAEMFKLQISSVAAGGNDQYDSGELPNITSLAHVDLLPNTENFKTLGNLKFPALRPNTTYFARMITRKRGTDFFADSTFTTGYGRARLIRPANGKGGVRSHPVFIWNAVGDASTGTPYKLDLGTAPGGTDVWTSGWVSGTQGQFDRPPIAPESVYYARLWTKKPGNITVYSDSAFSTGPFDDSKPAASLLLYPLHRQNDVDPLQPIVWSSVDNATYSLLIGTGTDRGKNDRDVAWASQTTHTSWAGGVSGGGKYYATLTTYSTSPSPCSVAMPCQTTQRIQFVARPAPIPHSVDGFNASVTAATATVRNMANAGNVPFPETFLFNNWDNESGIAVCSDFANNLSVQLQNAGVVARRRDTIFGLGPLQHSIVGYRDPLRQVWGLADADFDIVFSNPAGNPVTMNLLEVAAALDQGNAAAIPIQFATTSSVTQGCPECFGNYWVQNFSVDPMILYLNPTSYETGPTVHNDPMKFVVEYSGAVGVGGTYIFRFQSQSDSVVVEDNGTQYLLQPSSPVPTGRNFSQQLRPGDGWFYASPPPAGMQVYKLTCPVFNGVSCQ